MEMYTGRIVCCPLVSLIKFRKKDGTDRQTDAKTVNIMLTAKCSQRINNNNIHNLI